MKKTRSIITLIIIMLKINTHAQPTLNANNFAPVGSSYTFSHHSGSIPVGGSGPNQTWNLSSISYTIWGPTQVLDPSVTLCPNLFPASNYAINFPNNTYGYYLQTNSKIELMGINWQSNCTGGSTYSDYMTVHQFPFSYQDTYSDTYDNGTQQGTCYHEYDGYGTLITPFGTYNNVGRMKITCGSGTDYAWFDGTFDIIRTINNNSSAFIYSNFYTSVNNEKNSISISIFPNPFQSELNLTSNILLTNATALLINNLGQIVLEVKNINGKSLVLKRNNLPAGIYILQVQDNDKEIFKKKVAVVDF